MLVLSQLRDFSFGFVRKMTSLRRKHALKLQGSLPLCSLLSPYSFHDHSPCAKLKFGQQQEKGTSVQILSQISPTMDDEHRCPGRWPIARRRGAARSHLVLASLQSQAPGYAPSSASRQGHSQLSKNGLFNSPPPKKLLRQKRQRRRILECKIRVDQKGHEIKWRSK